MAPAGAAAASHREEEMAEPTIELRDLHGPFRGMVRQYLKSAGENAIATGFAERIETDAQAAAATPVELDAEASAPIPELDTPGQRRRRRGGA